MSASQFPPLHSKPSSRHCTNCSAAMSLYAMPGHYGNTVEIDVCVACHAIWFDQYESTQLSPDATVALFQMIEQSGGTSSRTATKFGESLRCPVCKVPMRLTHDATRNTRFTYQACQRGHGRLTTFFNFLTEKKFIRALTKVERARLAACVQQVHCSGCGAVIELHKSEACEYCGGAVSMFDREAARKAVDYYLKARQKQAPATPATTLPRAAQAWDFDLAALTGLRLLDSDGRFSASAGDSAVDLVSVGINSLLSSLFD